LIVGITGPIDPSTSGWDAGRARLAGMLATVPEAGGRLAVETLPWLAGLAVVVVVLWLAAVWLKRRIAGGDPTADSTGGFAPEELERLRRDGSLSEEQYRAISRSMVRRAAGLSKAEASTSEPVEDSDSTATRE